MKMNNKGIALVVVLFFSFSIAIILFFMAHSNTNLAFQNKQTIYKMQAYYMAHSGMQHVKLQLRLLPKETHDYFDQDGSGNPYISIDSTNQDPLTMWPYNKEMAEYDLFTKGKDPDDGAPYAAKYWVEEMELHASHESMVMTQDSYKITVKSEVDGGFKKKAEDEMTEVSIVSRFSGGVN